MTHPKFSASLILLIFVVITFFLIINGISSLAQADKTSESIVRQTPQVEESKTTTIKLQDKVWHGKISANETKRFELDMLFPYEGKFFIEATAFAYERRSVAYNKQPKIWKTLGQYLAYVTIKQGEEGKLERTKTPPKVIQKMEPIEGRVSSWDETAKRDSLKDKSTESRPKVILHEGGSQSLRESVRTGEPLLDLQVSFQPNPKLSEPTKLLLSLSSTAPRDSVAVTLDIPNSIKIIK